MSAMPLLLMGFLAISATAATVLWILVPETTAEFGE